jgi:hypothetical protein
MSGAVNLLHLYDIMAWTGTALLSFIFISGCVMSFVPVVVM